MLLEDVVGKRGSHQKLHLRCDSCGEEFYRPWSDIRKQHKKLNANIDHCKKCATKNRWKNTEAERAATSERMKLNNPMKNLESRNKMANNRRNMSSEMREVYAKGSRQAWADGKFDNVRVGQCEWFEYIKKDGTSIKCQGTWELAFAKWLDSKDLQFEAHKGRIPYIDDDGVTRSYYPDFYIVDWGRYIDVKNSYHWGLQKRKFELIQEQNPHLIIEIWLENKLKEKNII